MPDSVLYKRGVENADRQDDGAAYQIFCSAFLEQAYNQDKSQNHSYFFNWQLHNDFTFGDLVQNIPKIMHIFRTYTNVSLAKMNAEKTSAEDDEIHLIIHEAHEQAIAFAKVLEFVGYKNLFCGEIFIMHISAKIVSQMKLAKLQN
ncbi:hypothetical protein RhiirA4_513347, partial [Rhizophagus irregularis]